MDDSRGAGLPEATGARKTVCCAKSLRCGAAMTRIMVLSCWHASLD